MTRVLGYVPDLMDRSRITAAGVPADFVSSPSLLVGRDADVVVVDLGRPGVLEVLGDLVVPVIGFASHVDRGLLAAARTAGCQRVLVRSAFFANVAELLAGP
jgi:hypothetical protein